MEEKLKKFFKNYVGWKHSKPILQEDGSYIDNDGDQFWLDDDGHFHNEEGPALLNQYRHLSRKSNSKVVWVLHDDIYDFEEWAKKVNLSEEWDTYYRLIYDV